MSNLWQDIRYAGRMLARKPCFTTTVFITLAIGIGAVTAIITMMNATLYRMFPYKAPDRLVVFETAQPGSDHKRTAVSADLYREFQKKCTTFEEMTVYWARDGHTMFGWEDDDDSIKGLLGLHVAPNFFKTFGMNVAIGREFTPQEDCLKNAHVLILSDHIWRRRFSADPQILNKIIQIDGLACQVIGVMCPNYRLPASAAGYYGSMNSNQLVDYWIPLPKNFHDSRPWESGYQLFARLKSGVTIKQAQDEIDAIHAGILEQGGHHFYWDADEYTALVPLPNALLGRTRSMIVALIVAAAFVLLIACINVGNLLTVRILERKREMAIRSSLGCTRWRLIAQLTTENFILAFIGGFIGVLLAHWGVKLLTAFAPRNLPGLDQICIEPYILGISLLVTMASGLIVGLIPALRVMRLDPNTILKASIGWDSSSRREHRIQESLVTAEIALTLALLISAGLMIQSLWCLTNVDLGINTDRVLSITLVGPDATETALIERLQGLPNVEKAAVVSSMPITGSASDLCAVADVTKPDQNNKEWPVANICTVSNNSFEVLDISLKRGQFFADSDQEKAEPVVIVNESLANHLWPEGNAIGRMMKFRFRSNNYCIGDYKYVNRRVVGIVTDVKKSGPDSPAPLMAYVPFSQSVRKYFYVSVLVRSIDDPGNLIPAVRDVVHEMAPASRIEELEPLDTLLGDFTADRQFLMVLLVAFALTAFCLAIVGLYGVVANVVSRRIHEIAIRISLGAPKQTVLRSILLQNMRMIVPGIGTGLILAWSIRRLLASQLFGVASTDVLSLTVSSSLLATVALLACYIPARTVTKVDPMEALRYE